MPRPPILLILAGALAGCAAVGPAPPPVAAAPAFAPCQLPSRVVVVVDTASCLAQGGIVVP